MMRWRCSRAQAFALVIRRSLPPLALIDESRQLSIYFRQAADVQSYVDHGNADVELDVDIRRLDENNRSCRFVNQR